MPTKWSDLSHEGAHLRYIHNRVFKRFKKHSKTDNDEGMERAANTICTIANTQRRLVTDIKYESRLEEIEKILNAIPQEVILEAKMKLGA